MDETIVGTATFSVWRIDDLSTHWATHYLVLGEGLGEAEACTLAAERNRFGYSTRYVVLPDGELPPIT